MVFYTKRPIYYGEGFFLSLSFLFRSQIYWPEKSARFYAIGKRNSNFSDLYEIVEFCDDFFQAFPGFLLEFFRSDILFTNIEMRDQSRDFRVAGFLGKDQWKFNKNLVFLPKFFLTFHFPSMHFNNAEHTSLWKLWCDDSNKITILSIRLIVIQTPFKTRRICSRVKVHYRVG